MNLTASVIRNSVIVPFQGMYNSNLDAALDREDEQTVEHDHERQSDPNDDDWQPPELRVETQDMFPIYFECANHTKMHIDVAKAYLESLVILLNEAIGEGLLEIEFEEMNSPREYNFSTDRIFGFMKDGHLQYIFNEVDKVKLASLINENCTSRSGFISFYSNTLGEGDWAKPVYDWDAPQIEILLRLFIEQLLGDDWEDLVENLMSESGDIMSAYEANMDWTKVAEKMEEKRDEMRRALTPDYVRPPNPCQHTGSLFK